MCLSARTQTRPGVALPSGITPVVLLPSISLLTPQDCPRRSGVPWSGIVPSLENCKGFGLVGADFIHFITFRISDQYSLSIKKPPHWQRS